MNYQRVFAAALVAMCPVTSFAAEVISVFPTGSVKQVQQIVVKFSSDMVPMGDPRSHKDPFAVKCEGKDSSKKVELPKATARWVDNKSWSYDFAKPLSAGIQCTLTKVVAKDLAGEKVTALENYKFSTGGPALLAVSPRYGEIEPEQFFVLQLDGPMDTKSVESLAYFESDKLMSRIGIRIVTGPDREKIIRAAVASEWQFSAYKGLLETKRAFASMKEFDSFVIIAGKSRFAESSKLVLHWPKGIMSASQVPVDEAQKFDFDVISPFEAKFQCERVNPESPCNPILGMRLGFSRMVDRKLLAQVKLVGPGGATWMPTEFDKKAKKELFKVDADSDLLQALNFAAPFPANAKFKISLPPGLKDELGRPLANQAKFPLEVKTDEFTPLVKFAGSFGILERNAEPILPVSLRNVEKGIAAKRQSVLGKSIVINSGTAPAEVIRLYREVVDKESMYHKRGEPLIKDAKATAFTLPKPGGEKDFELVGIPLKEPGLHIVELMSPKLGAALLDGPPMYVASGALVTNIGVHLKKGRESSAIWVTTLDTAKPVAGADVSLITVRGDVLASGKTDASGLFHFGEVKYPCGWELENRFQSDDGHPSCEVYAFAKSGEDMSFVSSEWTRGIEQYRFNLSGEYLDAKWGPFVAHAVLDRSLLQTGETLHFKTFLRDATEKGFKQFAPSRLPKQVMIVHRATNKTFPVPFNFDPKTGSAVGEFKVPKDATLGYYEICLSHRAPGEKPATSSSEEGDGEGQTDFDWSVRCVGNFMVAEYRLPLMQSNVKIQGDHLIRPKEAKVDLSASYLSGGPASDLKVKVRASVTSASFQPDFVGAEEYTFFSSPMKVGSADENEKQADADLGFAFNQDVKLDTKGGALATVRGLPASTTVRSLVVEMEYRDPNGEVKTGRSDTTLFPAETIVGLRSESWLAKAGKATVTGVIVNPSGKPMPGHAYTVEAFRREYVTHRKRLVGGFYSYDSSSKTVSLGKVCEGKSDAKGQFQCEATKLPSGSVTLQARAADSQGRTTLASVGMSIYEEGEMSWWTPSDNDRVDLLPEKKSYEPGETAKLVLRSPFPTATVLVTVDREGVLDSFVREVKRDNPVIEVPMKGHYAPNIFVSALVLRGRVGDVKPTALIDLGKPAMKLGIAMIKVGWKAHELKVSVVPDKKRYRTREKALATIKVTRADGTPLVGADSEIAIAVVDESLALLRKNWSLDLLSGMMRERPLAVGTSSAQNQIIGKRHFGSKAKPPGGGGGAQGPENRELFDPMLLWLPRVKLDEKGEAKVSVTLNDSMTSFRINAVAHSGTNFFGSGSTVIESSKDLILYSGFAPVVRDGDQIKNALTIRNTTAKPMKVDLLIASKQITTLAKIPSFDLKPSESKIVEIPVTVPAGLTGIEYDVTAKDTMGGFSDGLKIKSRVQYAVPDQVLQATLFQIDKANSIPVQQPKDAIMGRGGLVVEARSTLLTGLSGVKAYMEDYPYSCLEQKVSKAIALEDSAKMKSTIQEMPSYLDGRGLLKFFPTSLCGSHTLSRYVLSISKANGYEIPNETKDQVLTGLTAWLNGKTCDNWWDSYLKGHYRDQERILVLETLSANGRFTLEQMKTVNITPNLWKTTTLVALHRLLSREKEVPNRDALIKQIDNILHARVNYQGSMMNLQGDLDWEAQWQLFSSRDGEAMDVLGLAIDGPSWQGDIGKMARGVMARLKKGAWDTTTANAWGVTEMRRFAAKYEKEKVAGVTSVTAPGTGGSFDWTKKPSGEKVTYKWPTGSEAKPVPVAFAHQGAGKPWMLMQTKSAIPLTKPMDFGYSVVRKVTRVAQDGSASAGPITWKNGDVANVELTITAKNDQPWVVIRDPIPAGASHLGSGLDGESTIMDRAPKARPSAGQVQSWPTEFEEKSQSHFVSYAAYLMKGTYKTNYRIRLNSTGSLKMPPTHVEALYSPESFGDAPIATWSIAP